MCIYRYTYVRYTYVDIYCNTYSVHMCTYIGALRDIYMYIYMVYICEVYKCAYIL